MKSRTVIGHQGMGDLMVINGGLRTMAKQSHIALPVMAWYGFESIKWMLRDDPRITVLPVSLTLWEDLEHRASGGEITQICERGARYDTLKAVESMYRNMGCPPSRVWDGFHFERDRSIEQAKPDGDYCFVHDDNERGFVIKSSRLPGSPAVRPSFSTSRNIFALLATIEGASEIHVIHSCFFVLCELIPSLVKGKRLCLHWYARRVFPLWPRRLKWEILK